MSDKWIEYFTVCWIVTGVLSAVVGGLAHGENYGPREGWAVGLLLFLLGPLVCMVYVYKSIRWLLPGYATLYRRFFPKKPQLPKAKALS